jgi:hypothetical protein
LNAPPKSEKAKPKSIEEGLLRWLKEGCNVPTPHYLEVPWTSGIMATDLIVICGG